MIHPEIKLQFINDQLGYGIFASKFIPKGTIVWTQCKMDRFYTLEEIQNLPESYWSIINRYVYVTPSGHFVLNWDHARFQNHSCEPNTIALNLHCDVAIRDIEPGEEITADYGTFNLYIDLTCHCKSPSCRHVIKGQDVFEHHGKWDALVEQTISEVGKVSQPLMSYLMDKKYLHDQMQGKTKFSQKMHYYSYKDEELEMLKKMQAVR